MSALQIDPHDKMRGRDVNKVARGEQAPRPPHEYSSIRSARPKPTRTPPPPSSSPQPSYKEEVEDENNPVARHCYAGYFQFHKLVTITGPPSFLLKFWLNLTCMCIKEKGEGARQCERFEKNYKSLCPTEWIEKWDEDQKHGVLVID